MNGQQDWPPPCMVVAGLTQLLHTQAWQRHSSQCFILRTHWRTQTPGLDSHHEASTSHDGNKPHEEHQAPAPSEPRVNSDRWITNSAHEMSLVCDAYATMHQKQKREVRNVISTGIHGPRGLNTCIWPVERLCVFCRATLVINVPVWLLGIHRQWV